MRRPAQVFDGFFSDDEAAVAEAIVAVRALPERLRIDEHHLFDPAIFGPDGADYVFGFTDVGGVAHPLVPSIEVGRMPVPPPGDRPRIAPFTSTQLLPWDGPTNLAWRELLRATQDRRRHGRASPWRDDARALVEARLRAVVECTRAPSPFSRDGWTPPAVDQAAEVRAGRPNVDEGFGDRGVAVVVIVWTGDAYENHVFDVDNGIVQVVGADWSSYARAFAVAHDGAAWRFFVDGHVGDINAGACDAAAFDIDGKGFVRVVGDHVFVHDERGDVVKTIRLG